MAARRACSGGQDAACAAERLDSRSGSAGAAGRMVRAALRGGGVVGGGPGGRGAGRARGRADAGPGRRGPLYHCAWRMPRGLGIAHWRQRRRLAVSPGRHLAHPGCCDDCQSFENRSTVFKHQKRI